MGTSIDKPRRDPRVATRTFDGETVIIDPDQNLVCMLNEVGSRIFELADGTRTPQEIAQLLSEEFQVEQSQAWDSTLRFLNDLEKRRILSRVL